MGASDLPQLIAPMPVLYDADQRLRAWIFQEYVDPDYEVDSQLAAVDKIFAWIKDRKLPTRTKLKVVSKDEGKSE